MRKLFTFKVVAFVCAGGLAVGRLVWRARMRLPQTQETTQVDAPRPLDHMDDVAFDQLLRGAGVDVDGFDHSLPKAEIGTDWNGAAIAEDGALVFSLRFHPDWIHILNVLWEHYLDDHSCEDVERAMGTVLEQMVLAVQPMEDAYAKFMMTDEGMDTMRALNADHP
jgi:hypothetical protein